MRTLEFARTIVDESANTILAEPSNFESSISGSGSNDARRPDAPEMDVIISEPGVQEIINNPSVADCFGARFVRDHVSGLHQGHLLD